MAAVNCRLHTTDWRNGPLQVHSVANAKNIVKHSRSVFLQGRHYERTVDALALRAEEGRGIAAKSVGELRASLDPTISEWGNPTPCGVTVLSVSMGGGHGGN